MQKKKYSNLNKVIWMSVLALFVCVCCTTYVWADRMESYRVDIAGAIELTPVDLTEEELAVVDMPEVVNPEISTQTNRIVKTRYYVERIPTNPGIEISDDQVVWGTNTEIEIFKISYENGQSEITVNSDNGDKLIAPGTSNSYTFKLKNTGDVDLDYTVSVDAYVTPGTVSIPVKARLNRYDGTWIVGDFNNYVEIPVLDTAEDQAILSENCFTYYTLDWVWPFESGNDDYDTYLGNLAVDEDLTLTIVINTTATATQDYYEHGIKVPNTGDDSMLGIWILLSTTSLFMLILLIYFKKKSDEESEQKKSELNS